METYRLSIENGQTHRQSRHPPTGTVRRRLSSSPTVTMAPIPWPAIARELTLVLAPSENPASIAPGLKSVLEADTASDAGAQLSELGIASIQTFDGDSAEGVGRRFAGQRRVRDGWSGPSREWHSDHP